MWDGAGPLGPTLYTLMLITRIPDTVTAALPELLYKPDFDSKLSVISNFLTAP
jgi:hypothetical protein